MFRMHDGLTIHSLETSCVLQPQISGLWLVYGVMFIENMPARKGVDERELLELLGGE